MAVEKRVADDRYEAAEEGGVILGGVDRLDRCQDGRGGDREGGVEGVIEVCFAGVGEDGALIVTLARVERKERGRERGDFVNVAREKDVNLFEEVALQE